MKVLYVGVWKDGTGWARAAQEYILALDAAGVEVVPRAVRLNDRDAPVPARLLELEENSPAGCDVVVQHLLPHMMEYRGGLKNVGLFASETSKLPSCWADRLNLMDGLVLVNNQQVDACRRSGVLPPLSVVPHASDLARYQRSYEPLDSLKGYREQGKFLFYFVGEMVRRKNLAALLKAFHLEFDPSEPVELLIRSDVPGMDADESHKHIDRLCQEVKRGLKLHGGKMESYKRELIISDRLSDEGVLRLHAACDCFVMPSFGEAWAYPAFDAMAMGKTPIVTACCGFLDYADDSTGWLVDCRPEPCFGEGGFPFLFTGAEDWWSADVNHLRRCMRRAYADSELRAKKAAAGIERAYHFSRAEVGRRLRGALAGD